MTELECLEAAYRALLRLHFASPFRIANQDILARLRSAVAERQGRGDEEVQVEFEAEAHRLTYVCRACRKPIVGEFTYQAGMEDYLVHKGCEIRIEPSEDGGI